MTSCQNKILLFYLLPKKPEFSDITIISYVFINNDKFAF